MHIVDVVTSPGLTGFFFDDQAAIKGGAKPDGFVYRGQPATPGYTAIRQPGESVSVLLLLDDGQIAHGDCAAVQYSGVGGRFPVFSAQAVAQEIAAQWADWLRGRTLTRFRPLAEALDQTPLTGPAPMAIRYGISQALLDAVAKARGLTMAEVLAEEYGTQLSAEPVPIFVQSGDELYTSADKMILKHVAVLPHGLINNVARKVGRDGGLLLDYVRWLAQRIAALGGPDYRPRLHLDTYGTLGLVFGDDLARMADYLGRIAEAASPYPVQLEGPLDAGSRPAQIEALGALRQVLRERGINVPIVADEWCNTLDDARAFIDAGAADFVQVKTPSLGSITNSIAAIQYAQARGIYSYLGGSCNETDRCGQVCAHIALALSPDQVLAKPGMGVDEGLMIVHNEMQRGLALIRHRAGNAARR